MTARVVRLVNVPPIQILAHQVTSVAPILVCALTLPTLPVASTSAQDVPSASTLAAPQAPALTHAFHLAVVSSLSPFLVRRQTSLAPPLALASFRRTALTRTAARSISRFVAMVPIPMALRRTVLARSMPLLVQLPRALRPHVVLMEVAQPLALLAALPSMAARSVLRSAVPTHLASATLLLPHQPPLPRKRVPWLFNALPR